MYISSLDEERIYRILLNKSFKINVKIHSPFRKDNNPSFVIFESTKGTNKFLWKDFATGEVGNVIKFVMLYYNIDFKEAIKKIEDITTLSTEDRAEYDYEKALNSTPVLTKLNIQLVDWTQEGLAYWRQYKVTQDYLKFFNVYQTLHIFSNNSIIATFSYNDPIYTYVFKNNNTKLSYKIYRPYNKKFKWLSEVNGLLIEGYDQVAMERNKPLLIITKSLKDCIVLRLLGYYAIAAQSETAKVDDFFIDQCKLISNNLLVFLDNDETGIKQSKKINELYKIPYIFIPERFNIKDISDFIKEQGIEKTVQLMKTLTNYII